jgi:hypothetical protein
MGGRDLEGVRAEKPAGRRVTGKPSQPQEYGEQCGGAGGVPYRVVANPPASIRKVTVFHKQYVDGIQLATEDGALPQIGGTGRHKDVRADAFELAENEFITGLSLEYWNYIDRITFHTNLKSYGPFGGAGGRVTRELKAPAGRQVLGLAGRHWEFIDSIQLIVG